MLSFCGCRFPAESLWPHVVSRGPWWVTVGDNRCCGSRAAGSRGMFFAAAAPSNAGRWKHSCWVSLALPCLKTQSLELLFHRMRLRFTSRGCSLGQASLERVRFPDWMRQQCHEIGKGQVLFPSSPEPGCFSQMGRFHVFVGAMFIPFPVIHAALSPLLRQIWDEA